MMESFFAFALNAAHYLVPFLVVLAVVVFVHEFGHFIIARINGVRVESFSIGFGPEIVGWNDRYGTHWRIAWLPLGGYVKMFGDSDPASLRVDNEKIAEMTEAEKKVAFYTQKVRKRFAIVAAGPLMNYLFAVVVLAVLYAFAGQSYTAPVVETVMEGSAAAEAGIQVNDRVLSIDGQPVSDFDDIKRIVALNMEAPVSVAIERNGVRQDITATPKIVLTTDRFGLEHRIGRLGIASTQVAFRQLSPVQAVWEALRDTWHLTASTLKGVGQMIIGVRDAEELGGPLRIAEMSGKVAREGLSAFVWFLAVISVNLGLINLFPIPLLDGGHLLFYFLEGVRGRPLGERAQNVGAHAGLTLVVVLMLFATWNDLVHLKVISYIRGLFS